MSPAQKRGLLLMRAYLAYDSKKNRQASCWLYLLEWAALGGNTSEVPAAFGGTAV